MLDSTVLLAIHPSLARREYGAALMRQGFDVVTADDGLQCLERLRESLPDVLVIEPELPWGGGDGVLEMVHEELELHGTSVFVLTAERNRSAMYRISRFPNADFAMQPLGVQQLVERVRKLTLRTETMTA